MWSNATGKQTTKNSIFFFVLTVNVYFFFLGGGTLEMLLYTEKYIL